MPSPARSRLRAILALTLAVVATEARADDATELERGKTSYDAGRYEEGARRFREMLDASSPHALHDPALQSRARTYFAACLLALARVEEADREIERVVRDDPSFRPDPVEMPGKLVDRFTDVRARVLRSLDKDAAAGATTTNPSRDAWLRYVAELERMASEEVVTTRRSRFVAAVPFGVGQFQNGDAALGWTLFAAEAALAGLSIGSAVAWQVRVAQHDQPNVDTAALNDRISAARTLNLWSTAAFGVVAIAGVVQAEIAFTPEAREVRRRPVPKPPAIAPTFGASSGGVSLGFVGAF